VEVLQSDILKINGVLSDGQHAGGRVGISPSWWNPTQIPDAKKSGATIVSSAIAVRRSVKDRRTSRT